MLLPAPSCSASRATVRERSPPLRSKLLRNGSVPKAPNTRKPFTNSVLPTGDRNRRPRTTARRHGFVPLRMRRNSKMAGQPQNPKGLMRVTTRAQAQILKMRRRHQQPAGSHKNSLVVRYRKPRHLCRRKANQTRAKEVQRHWIPMLRPALDQPRRPQQKRTRQNRPLKLRPRNPTQTGRGQQAHRNRQHRAMNRAANRKRHAIAV